MRRSEKERLNLDHDWKDYKACKDVPTSLFFPEQEDFRVLNLPGNPGHYCLNCPVASRCLEYALAIHERHGIWGGINEKRRRHMINDRTSIRRTRMRNERLQRMVPE